MRDQTGRRNPFYKHGMTGTPEYRAWKNMIQRCTNPQHPGWSYYGARGIKVCRRWRSFKNFFADMGKRPPGLTLERKKNHLGYGPGNCHWATRKVQQRNTRWNRLIKFRGRERCASAWAERFDIPIHRVYQWNRRGTLQTKFSQLMKGDFK